MNTDGKYVAVVGNLLSYGAVICFLLKRYNINSISVGNNNLETYSNKKIIKNASFIISLGPSVLYEFGLINCMTNFVIKNKKIAFITQGSDITEFINENSLYSKFYRYLLRRSVFNLFSPYSMSIKNLLHHRINNMFWSKHPHLLPQQSNSSINLNDSIILSFFHCSNFDWGVTDNKLGRNSTKGNDRFLGAFKKALEKGIKAHCHILDRGPDHLLAKKFIEDNKLEKYFTWYQAMDKKTLHEYMLKSDIIVDQFDVGGLGGIACEAMAQAKPVMIYLDKNCWPLVYDEEPPVINCHTEDEIYNAIIEWSDRKKLQELGERAEKWVRKYHDVHTADFSEFILRVCLAAGVEWPRQDLAKVE